MHILFYNFDILISGLPGGPVVKTSLSNAGGMYSIPEQWGKIPHTLWPEKPKHETEARW